MRLLNKTPPQAERLSGLEKSIWNKILQDVTIVNSLKIIIKQQNNKFDTLGVHRERY